MADELTAVWIAGRLCGTAAEAKAWIQAKVPESSRDHWVVLEMKVPVTPALLKGLNVEGLKT